MAVSCADAAIKGLGLEVTPENSGTMWLCRKAHYGSPPEVGKLFDRVIVARPETHLSERVHGWHESRYGFLSTAAKTLFSPPIFLLSNYKQHLLPSLTYVPPPVAWPTYLSIYLQ